MSDDERRKPQEQEGISQTPEKSYLETQELSDISVAVKLPGQYPIKERSGQSRIEVEPGHYWGLAIATTLAKLGTAIGIEKDPGSDKDQDLMLFGSNQSINYWLHLTGFEHRLRGGSADSESRSGVFTMLVDPSHSELFEHVYAVHTNTAIEDIMKRDPRFAQSRAKTKAAEFEIIDHEGVERMYREDPEHVIRLYLTRQLPQLVHLRNTIDRYKKYIDVVELESQVNEASSEQTKEVLKQMIRERQANLPINKPLLEYWQSEYDFTVGLLLEGHRPYNFSEIEPFVEEYVLGLLATKPELSPTDLQASVPDVQANIKKLLKDLETRSKRDDIRRNANNN